MSTKQDLSKQAQERVQLEKERVKRQGEKVKSGITPIKAYLLAYNAVATLLWARLLITTVSFLITSRPGPPTSTAWWTRLLASSPTARRFISSLPTPVTGLAAYLAGSYDYNDLGVNTKWTQTLAALEVVHAALGWVRSPVGTTAAQVASRLYTVWGVVEAVPSTHANPLFTTMVFAWSLTEVIRYSFYFFSLLSVKIPILDWLRYSTFYALYPLGASSEAFISFSTLPPLANLPIPNSIKALNPLRWLVTSLPEPLKSALVKTVWGRRILFNLARIGAGVGGVVKGRSWGSVDYGRLVLFVIWWPSLYVLFTYMVKQRKRVLGKGKTVGGVNKAY